MTQQPQQNDSLTVWIDNVLFTMNMLLTVLVTILIVRFRGSTVQLFEDFGVELPLLARISLSIGYAVIIPVLGGIAVVVKLFNRNPRERLVIFSVHFIYIVIASAVFLGTVLPAIHRLLDQLRTHTLHHDPPRELFVLLAGL